MSCTVTVYYSATAIPGTPSAGQTYSTQSYSINVPDGNWIGEMVSAGNGFGPCPGVAQFWVQARDPSTGEILGAANTNTCADVAFLYYTNSCPATQPDNSQLPHDCINGACIKKSTYNTPGIYKSLSECEIACGTGCSGNCISNSEWAQIKGLSNQLRNRNCG
ncbi:hypothetical protein [Nostoc sp. DSM 114167]|jgi:hypothetical protein|uniref:hypothetical protein n=1 Tax=Nostoc sp. DSM 114167 TaxID=3439050 RepID=UPI00404593C4